MDDEVDKYIFRQKTGKPCKMVKKEVGCFLDLDFIKRYSGKVSIVLLLIL